MSSGDEDLERIRAELRDQRWDLLARIHGTLEPAFVALSAVWVALVVAELVGGGLPRSLEAIVWVIWGLFIAEFVVGLIIAPARTRYLREQWLTAVSLVLPAFRILRVVTVVRFFRAARVVRSVGLLRIATSLNRGLSALGRTARRRGLGYVVAATAIVMVVGAAGMAFFEGETPASSSGTTTSFADYGEALWWTAYAMTTGAPTTPTTAEGRLLGWLLSVYGLAIFGYLTATLASHFIGRDRADEAA